MAQRAQCAVMNSGAQQCPKLPKTISHKLKSFKAVQIPTKEKPADLSVDLTSYRFVISPT
jgi:hypothetical protein